MTQQITQLEMLRDTVHQWRRAGERVALVPTMGALHAGHMSLVAEAKKHADRVVVSIFVNPTQFGPNEDFHRYPRPIERDLALLSEAGADAAWTPDVATMYPTGFATSIKITGITEPLEGRFRPGHFDGVATVVAKLLSQVGPDIALFGEKDYQQLALIKKMIADLDIPIEILGVPTLREADGLAMSSRNQYLNTEQRQQAAAIHAALKEAAMAIKSTVIPAQAGISREAGAGGEGDSRLRGNDGIQKILDAAKNQLLDAGFSRIDYLELRDPITLEPTEQAPARLLVAAHLGTTRLIDNIEL